MRLTRAPRKTPPETIIALIDVVFFLLIFFMLVGRMDASAPFEVLPPESSSGADMPGGGVTVSVAADGTLALDGLIRERAEVLDALATVIADDPETLVRINADKAAQLRKILPLTSAIEALGAREVVLVLTPEAP